MLKRVSKFSETQVLEGIKRGNRDVLKHIYQKYWPTILKMVTGNGVSEDNAKDIFQEGIITIRQHLMTSDFKLTCKLTTYLYSVCRYACFNFVKHESRFVDIMEYVEIHQITEPRFNHLDIEAVEEEIRKLGYPCKQLLLGYYYHNMSAADIAHEFDLKTIGNARKKKYDCLQKVKKNFFPQMNKTYAS
ncbi:sigma-70 family RNA polymerase sigma factor [Fulvivirga sp. M361]|uniref:RNA polymerase sigma factor n=1 Tax=Fulvivirga sp. M361 TaxID=2594266 RepID=UPI00117A04F4|nr:sigma-70 family RNA polymerase sigma factor [Fulvivirga sp. M361]TRX46483.1 sigma-70 family RNA polymerase sigma factor [Fulvivirga sp. M361]